MATLTEAARHVFLGDRRFFELIEAGAITRQAPGGYSLDDVRREYVMHIRRIAAGRGAQNGVDLAAQRAKLAREQTEAAAMRNAIARGEYVSIDEVGLQLEAEYGIVRQRLLAIPGKLADSLEGLGREEREAAIAAEITEALTELHAAEDIRREMAAAEQQ